jgi:hypothetical protein
LERKVKKILQDVVGASTNQFSLGLTACDSYALETSTFCGLNACSSILDGHGNAGRTVNTLAGQEIDFWIGFTCTNVVASDHLRKILEQA